MSDRIKALTVVLEDDYRDDSLQGLIAAISLFRGVIGVEMVKTDGMDYINRSRIRSEFEEKLWNALKEKTDGN